jgi:hypothetical protein
MCVIVAALVAVVLCVSSTRLALIPAALVAMPPLVAVYYLIRAKRVRR